MSLNPERANLRQLVESVVRVFDGLARQKSLTLALDLDARINTDVLIDPLRFKQILSNLISNAIKFTEQGQIRISLHTEDGLTPQQLQVHVTIHDSGIGISPEDQKRLFEPFAQVDNSGQLARTGAGLGLVICRSLCEMMGGTLSLDSQPGDGTRIDMTLDLTTLDTLEASSLPRDAAPHTAGQLNILIVDDHPANRLLLLEQLCYLGHRCEMAVHGAEGLQRWRSGHFDLVIADCNMPVMNGYDLARGIRDQERSESLARCTILGFTANAQAEEIQRCRDAGMDDCLFKPVSLTALNDRLCKVIPLHLPPADDPDIFAPDSITALTGGREGMSRRLIEQLIVSNVEDREELAAVMHLADRQQLRDIGHKIRGAARIISARHVIEMCEALEDACDEDASDEVIGARQMAVAAALRKLEYALRAHLENTE